MPASTLLSSLLPDLSTSSSYLPISLSMMRRRDLFDSVQEEEEESVGPAVGSTIPVYVEQPTQTTYEIYLDLAIGLAFLLLAIIASKRMVVSRQQQNSGAAETAVVTAFYSLILCTSALRAVWFFIPSSVWQPTYTPTVAVFAWDPSVHWMRVTLSELVVTIGSLCLFSIFILILVYWADILKKYFHPGSRRSLPMHTFLLLVLTLVGLELINIALFLYGSYSTEGMILYNAVLLAWVSMICVVEITIFSHRFRTVLKTLGAINQVSTDSQVRRIVWITITGNLFFVSRALLETAFAILLFVYWHRHGNVEKVFSHRTWDIYTNLKYWSEVTILALMLYILQSRFSSSSSASRPNHTSRVPQSVSGGYTKVPDTEPKV